MRTKASTEEGFTLLEVMLAFTILAIAAIPFFAFITQSMMFSVENEEELSGINAAREVLSFIHDESVTTDKFGSGDSLDWSFLTADDPYRTVAGNPYALQFPQNGTDYFIQVIFTSVRQPVDHNQLQPVGVEVYSDPLLQEFVTETFGYIKKGDIE